jgi:hypothetical protein
VNLLARLILIVAAIACATSRGSNATNQDLGLPLLLEHNLPNKLQLLAGDSIVAFAMLRNTTQSPVVVKFGSAALKIQAREVGRSIPSAASNEPRQIGDVVEHWGVVRYLESPSPYAVYTSGLNERTLNAGDSLQFSWRADPLPVGHYFLKVCLNILESPRRGEGGWQEIHWCAARGIDLKVLQR